MDITVNLTDKSRINEVDFSNIPFGKVFSDHMFIVEYKDGKWQTPSIQKYDRIEMSPALLSIHYGQSIFEGMKAYKNSQGEMYLFRPEDNINRMNKSAERMCMPPIPTDMFLNGLKELIKIDQNWIPDSPGSSLYIRPVYFAADEFIGVRPSETYKFIILTCPVTTYYSEPVKVLVETEYSRACPGGTGFAKAAGNYAGALYPAKLAQQKGYHQLIWTDAISHEYVEESGTMNLMAVIDGKLYTPELSTTTLAGVTRDTVLTVARAWGMEVIEKRLKIAEIIEGIESGKLTELFGTGTAATIAHIILLGYQGKDYDLPALENREFSNKVSGYLDNLRTGQIDDPFGWRVEIK